VNQGGASKKRPSPHLHKVPTRSNEVSPRTLQTALVFFNYVFCDFYTSHCPHIYGLLM